MSRSGVPACCLRRSSAASHSASATSSVSPSICDLGAGGPLGPAARHPPERARRTPGCRRAGHAVGQGDHLGSRPVVADELDPGGTGEALRELGQVRGRGAGEGVDGLPRVAHHAQVVTIAQPAGQQRHLHRADVLVLVDGEPAVLAAHLRGHPVVVVEQRHGGEQQVLHVEAAALALDLLVGGEHVRRPSARRVRPPPAPPAARGAGSRQGGRWTPSPTRSRRRGRAAAPARCRPATGGPPRRGTAASTPTARAARRRTPSARSSGPAAVPRSGTCAPARRVRRARPAGCASRRPPGS